MEQTLFELIKGGMVEFLHTVNWIFVVIFVLLTWLLNEGGTSSHPATKWLTWMDNTWPISNKSFRALLFGALLAIPFSWLQDLKTKKEFTEILYGIFIGMAVWKLGIDWIVRIIKNRFFPTIDKPADQV